MLSNIVISFFLLLSLFFFFNDTAPTEIYTLSLHDALPIFGLYVWVRHARGSGMLEHVVSADEQELPDRKSTRLNSSHRCISYAVFCLKKKNIQDARRRLKRRMALPASTPLRNCHMATHRDE